MPTSASCASCSDDAIDTCRAAGRGDLVDSVDNQFFDLLTKQQFPNGVPGLDEAQIQRITELNDASGGEQIVPVRDRGVPADQDPDLPFSIG